MTRRTIRRPTRLPLMTREPTDDLQDDRADFLAKKTDDTPAIVDRDIASDTLPDVDSIPATINASTDVVTKFVITPQLGDCQASDCRQKAPFK